jgi:hypothetical protein
MKRRNIFIRLGLGLALVTAPLTALALTVPGLVGAASATSPKAAFSTTNVGWGASPGNGACLAPATSANPVNCNAYTAKEDVWLNGGPSQGLSTAGTYFFTVLDPGGQGDPNDLSAGNLSYSDTYTAGGNYTAREFTVDGSGNITGLVNPGTHAFDSGSGKIELAPFDDTANPGGVYIMAICFLGPTGGTFNLPVNPSSCKYDAFRVVGTTTPLNVFSAPTIFKFANLDYTSTDNWTIAKTAASPTTVETSSSTATFTYTVTVTMTGATVSDVTINGNIDVFNANLESDGVTTQPMDLSTLSDQLSGGSTATCVIASGAPDLTLSAADLTYPYTCDLGNTLPTSPVFNTASMSWAGGQISGDTSGSASMTVPVNVDSPTLKDQSVTVSDPNAPSSAGLPMTFTGSGSVMYSIGWPVIADTCTSYTNTATMVTFDSGVSTTASATVSVCGPASGGLTMGFWQNKNGQAIISGGHYTGTSPKICNSGSYLRTLKPFNDLSATATCATVATYVTNIIKAANASGASMNAMLKSQMLATALDVYFSGNEGDPLHSISLGGVRVDLTNIGGVNESAAFSSGCETVNAMLTDASIAATTATAANTLASPWYGQTKAVQGKAEASFDAVNNGVAFSC